MTVNNNTSRVLKFLSDNKKHGKYTKDPPKEISATGYWACDMSGVYGPEGSVTYEAEDKSFKVKFEYDHPYTAGKSTYKVIVTPSNAIDYDIKGSFKGHDQDITFNLFAKY